MPYEWDIPITTPPSMTEPGHAMGDRPIARLHLWPFRSLPKRGYAVAIGCAYLGLMIPVAGFIGTAAMWWLFVPGLIAVLALWWFIGKNYRDGEILEELTIWPDRVMLTRDGPRHKHAEWEANPHWVTAIRHKTGGPMKDYITLKGNGREVEIGSFLSEDERPVLFEDLQRAFVLAKSRTPD